MDDEFLNFNYPLLPKNQIQLETTIKQQIRNQSLNKTVLGEIERYTDKYLETVSYTDVMRSINNELLSVEMQKIQGVNHRNESNIVINDINEEDEVSQIAEGQEDEVSLDGGDDYEHNYYDEDERSNGNEYEELF